MRVWRRVLLVLLLICGAMQATAAVPSIDFIKKNLATLSERKLPENEQQLAQQTLEQTLVWLDAIERAKKAQSSLEQQLSQAPQQIQQNKQALAQLAQQTDKQISPNLTILQLEQLVGEQTQQLEFWQKELNDASALIIRTQTRPERAQLEVSNNQKRIQEINAQIKGGKEGGKALLLPEALDRLQAELGALQERNKLNQAELAGNSVLQDLASSNRELLAAKVQTQERYLIALQEMLNKRRQAASEQAVQEQSLGVEKAGEDALLLKESSLNLKLSDYLLTVTERRNQLTQKSLQVRQQLENVQQIEQALEEQISVLQGSLLLAKILYQQKQALPQLSFDQRLTEQIADTRLYQFELRQLRETVQRPQEYVDSMLLPLADDNPQLRADLLGLVTARNELLQKLNHELNAYLSEAIRVQLNQKQLQSTAKMLHVILDEQMFWVPSNKAVDRGWFKSLPAQLKQQWRAIDIGTVFAELWPVWRDNVLSFFPVLLLTLLVLWKRTGLRVQVQNTQASIGHYLRDRQFYTPLAVLAVAVVSLPIAALFATAGWLAQLHTQSVAYEFGTALLNMAKLGLVFSIAYRLLAKQGVAQVHFAWPAQQVEFLRKRVAWLALVVWLLALVVPLAQARLSNLSEDVLGSVLLAVGLLALSFLLGSAVLHKYVEEPLPWWARGLGMFLAFLPVLFVGALASGYYYTVLQLTERLLTTLVLLVVWIIMQAMLERGLIIAARRLAWQRAEKARSNQQESNEAEQSQARMGLNISEVNQQSLRLVRLLLLLTLTVGIYWIWADVISLFAYLDNVVLYEDKFSNDLNAAQAILSLRDLLNAAVIVAMTAMLARNLPGLLEVLFFSRLNLAQGSAYAAIRLLTYATVSAGFVMTLAVLGVSWSKLQWLVAALSVGLGFGLQEIFANFVSGLIILFERPVRIGDVVTIGNLSGTVNRIRIRATTIIDFDRKEIIVPNKVFVTERLINWSLSDTVTRVVVNIGLAYDTDLDLARKLMLQTLQENSRIMSDPEPVVLFLGISESIFDHELRYHVRELGDRNPSIDEVLNQLVVRFREHKIEMAFKQLEVFIKNAQGEQAHWSTKQRTFNQLQPKQD